MKSLIYMMVALVVASCVLVCGCVKKDRTIGEQWKIWECSTGENNVVCDVDKEHYINFCDRIKDRVYMSEAGDSDNLIILDIEELFQGKIYDGKKIYASIKS